MSKPATYTPRPGSLPSEVIYFFRNNPDEELTLDDITDKFDCSRGSVHTNLGQAVDAGMLVRDRNVDGEYIYKAGPKLPPAAPASPVVTPAPATAKKPRAAPAELPSIDSIDIDDGIPLPSAKRPKVDWKPLLTKLKAGQSFKVPMQAKHTLSLAMTELRKANQGSYTIRVFKDTQEVRVWRTA